MGKKNVLQTFLHALQGKTFIFFHFFKKKGLILKKIIYLRRFFC